MTRRTRTVHGSVIGAVVALVLVAPMAASAAPAVPDRVVRSVAAPGTGDPNAHLADILAVSDPPTYRRFGSPGLAAAADGAAAVLRAAGFQVLRHDVPSRVWDVDYTAGHEPSLVRTSDGHAFRTESAFNLGRTTGPDGVTCTVRMWDQVQPGDCGFVPFDMVSPAWNNIFANGANTVSAVADRGGVAAILQGDVHRQALVAVLARRAIPAVVSLVTPADVLGQTVTVRAMGATVPATMHNVIGVRPPSDPSRGYVLVQGHLDGWFTAAADNAAGAAAVLAAAERLVGDTRGRGLLVALYDAEEWGLRGSEAFARDLGRPEGLRIGECGPVVHLSDIVANVNFDVPSAIASDAFGAVQAVTGQAVPLVSYRVLVFSEDPVLAALLTATSTLHGALGAPVPVSVANPINGGASRTDVKWFHEAGIPAAWPVVGYPEYHTTADTIVTVDPADLERVTAGMVDLVRLIDTIPIGRLQGSTLGPPGSVPQPALPAGCGAAAPAAAVVAPTGATLPATGGTSGASAPWAAALALPVALLLLATTRRARSTP